MVYSIHNCKMAEGTWNRERFASGRARALIDVRAGIVPLNQTRALNRSTSEDSRQNEGQIPCGAVRPYQQWNIDQGPFCMEGKR